VAARYGTLHLDLTSHPCIYDSRMWSVDRLHPSERGHRYLAGAYVDLLGGSGFPVGPPPGPDPTSPSPTRAAQLRWMATEGVSWVLKRSTDLLPYLMGMAVRERWYELRGRLADLEARAQVDLAAVRARYGYAEGGVGTRS